MSKWIKVGHRFLNLNNVCEVRYDPQARIARLVFVGGMIDTISEDEAADINDALLRRSTVTEESHRSVFAPVDS